MFTNIQRKMEAAMQQFSLNFAVERPVNLTETMALTPLLPVWAICQLKSESCLREKMEDL